VIEWFVGGWLWQVQAVKASGVKQGGRPVAKLVVKSAGKLMGKGKGKGQIFGGNESKGRGAALRGSGRPVGRPKGSGKKKGPMDAFLGRASVYLPPATMVSEEAVYVPMNKLQVALVLTAPLCYKTCGVMEGPIGMQGFVKKRGGGYIQIGGFGMSFGDHFQVFKVRILLFF